MDELDVRTGSVVLTARKALATAAAFVATLGGVVVADYADAKSWIASLIVVLGGAVGTASTYWTENKPKRPF